MRRIVFDLLILFLQLSGVLLIGYAVAMLQPENQLADLAATGRWSL